MTAGLIFHHKHKAMLIYMYDSIKFHCLNKPELSDLGSCMSGWRPGWDLGMAVCGCTDWCFRILKDLCCCKFSLIVSSFEPLIVHACIHNPALFIRMCISL